MIICKHFSTRLKSQNIMTIYVITISTTFSLQNSCILHWPECHKSLVDSSRQTEPDVQAAVTEIRNIPTWFFYSSKLTTKPQMCSLSLRSGEVGGRGINWNSSLNSRNLSSTIRSLSHGALSS